MDPVNGIANYGSHANSDLQETNPLRRSASIKEKRVSLHGSASGALRLGLNAKDEESHDSHQTGKISEEQEGLYSKDGSDADDSEAESNTTPRQEYEEIETKDPDSLPQFSLARRKTTDPPRAHGANEMEYPSTPKWSGKILTVRSASSVFQACDTSIDSFAQKHLQELPRGGYWCKLGESVIQFGCPPETIKDSMTLGLPVPQYFVILGNLFSRTKGINCAEIEFPAYFNYFIRKRRTVVITTAPICKRIRALFQETLLGPKASRIRSEQDFLPGTSPDAFPNFKAEGEWLDAARKTLRIDDLLEFSNFQPTNMDATGFAHMLHASICDEKISIDFDRKEKVFRVHAPDFIEPPGAFSLYGEAIVRSIEMDARSVLEENARPAEAVVFDMPVLGVTMLGTSHGFDPMGQTTGFVVWGNRRGTMVDPPPYAIECLDRLGIPTRVIDSVVLTHCHSDHDAGTFRRLLFDQHITIYTTTTIFESFTRKYSAITGLSPDFLRCLLVFRNVCIGEDVFIHGAKWNFFYSLHTIPCIGFKVSLQGKTIAYSADTHNDPALFQRMYDDGVIGRGRMESLSQFPWDADLILHEAGVPPIHTPMQRLVDLPEETKEKLYVVHVAAKDVPKNSGLRFLQMGDTRALDVEASDVQTAIEIIDVLSTIDIFHEACHKFHDAVHILLYFQVEEFEAGELIVRAGDPGDKCYIILRGAASVSWVANGVRDSKRFSVGDYFGETSLVTGAKRNADVHAVTPVRVATISQQHFNTVVRGTNIRRDLISLSETRKTNSWQLICQHAILGKLSSTAKTQLEVLMEEHHFVAGEVAWEYGDSASYILLVQSGLFHLKCDEVQLRNRDLALSVSVDKEKGELQIMSYPMHRTPSSLGRDPAIPLTRVQADLASEPSSTEILEEMQSNYESTKTLHNDDLLEGDEANPTPVRRAPSLHRLRRDSMKRDGGLASVDIQANATEDLCGPGALIGDFDAVFADAPVVSTCFCVNEGTALVLTAAKWRQFCGRYPGGFLFFLNKHITR